MTYRSAELRCMLLVASLTTMGGAARADPVRAALAVTRDDGARDCPDAAALALRVEQIAGRLLFETGGVEPADTWVTVEFVRDFGGLRAVISARGSRQGTRTLDDVGPECTSLADAVAITLAILLDPAAMKSDDAGAQAAAAVPAAGLPTAVASSTAATPPLDSTASRTPETKKRNGRIAFGVEGSAGVSIAVLDGMAPFVEAGGRARAGGVFSLGLGGGFVLPDRVPYGNGNVDVSLGFGSLRGCANLLPGRLVVLEACLEPMLGGLRGSGDDYETTDTEWLFWSAASALIQSYGPISESVFWSFRARALAPFVRHGFSVSQGNDPEEAFKLSGIGGTFAVGLQAEL